MDELLDKIIEWADSKELLNTDWAAIYAQLSKFEEEVDELRQDIMGAEMFVDDFSASKMELGDCVVVLTILAEQMGTDLQSCLQMAYDKISKRTGRTENGIFIKDE